MGRKSLRGAATPAAERRLKTKDEHTYSVLLRVLHRVKNRTRYDLYSRSPKKECYLLMLFFVYEATEPENTTAWILIKYELIGMDVFKGALGPIYSLSTRACETNDIDFISPLSCRLPAPDAAVDRFVLVQNSHEIFPFREDWQQAYLVIFVAGSASLT